MNGQLESEFSFKNNDWHGIEKRWYENGQLSCESEYVNGAQVKRKEWDRNGKLTLETTN